MREQVMQVSGGRSFQVVRVVNAKSVSRAHTVCLQKGKEASVARTDSDGRVGEGEVREEMGAINKGP